MFSAGCPALERCSFIGNQSVGAGLRTGGGLFIINSECTSVVDCVFAHNKAQRSLSGSGAGGGVAIDSSYPTFVNCLFFQNQSDGGGAIDVQGPSGPTITNCTIAGNSADSGGGIRSSYGSLAISNCILWGNVDSEGSSESAQILILSGDLSVSYSCIQGLESIEGQGNIGSDPLFANPGSSDFRLGAGSPCIDSGNNDADTDASLPGVQTLPDTDLDGQPRIQDGDCTPPVTVDMGAYERASGC